MVDLLIDPAAVQKLPVGAHVIHPAVAREPGRSVVALRDDDGSPFAVVELS